ncbi:MAG: hypothetical protein D4R57_01630 [Verrucomicrobiales bacterium]|nr:MAG: hypothetical protein D4R57_01630 [Verrucomicrobiales bacterium]
MAFDPTKPANNSPLDAAEMRSQLTALKTLIDACPTTRAMEGYVSTNAAGSCLGVSPLGMTAQTPPSAAQIQEIADKLDELLAALRRGA